MTAPLIIERNFAADPATVFRFVTENGHLMQWWGPEGINVTDHALDFTRTGPWHSVMTNADGGRYKVSGTVLVVEPPHMVEITWGWHDDNDQRGHESRVRFEIAPGEKGGARFRLIHSDLADDESATAHDEGWTSSIRKLGRMAG